MAFSKFETAGTDRTCQELSLPRLLGMLIVSTRSTIRRILGETPHRSVWTLTYGSGCLLGLALARYWELGRELPSWRIVMFVLATGFLAQLGLYMLSMAAEFFSRHLKCYTSACEIRTALAWGSTPLLTVLPFWVGEALLVGQQNLGGVSGTLFQTGHATLAHQWSDYALIVSALVAAMTCLLALAEAVQAPAWKLSLLLLALLPCLSLIAFPLAISLAILRFM